MKETRLGAGLLLAFAAPVLGAQTLGSGNGFLLGPPTGSISFHAGYAGARAGSDVFTFTDSNLTLNKADYGGLTFGADASFRLADRTDLLFSADYAGTSHGSAFRNFVDNNNQPITQTTDFKRIPLTASLKQYLTSPGRSIGRYAWVPTHIAPFIGAGGGIMWYTFHQSGDWVDFNTDSIFTAELESSGWTPTVHAFAGADLSLTPRLALTAQAKYTWAAAKPDPSGDFGSFDRFDLAGFATTVGLTVRY